MKVMKKRGVAAVAAAMLAATAVTVSGCSSGGGGVGADQDQTIVVWDYYGSASPITAAVPEFEKTHKNIKVQVEALDWDSMLDKFPVAVSSGAAPDLVTADMTWLPTFASGGLLSDLAPVSHDTINGKAFSDVYNAGALEAMKYKGTFVAAMYDFDAYCLYYRSDVLKAKGLTVPTTWDEFLRTVGSMAEDTNGDGTFDKYALQVLPDTFHFAQLLAQNGGRFLNEDDTVAEFNSDAGVGALAYMQKLLDAGGIYWGPSEGDSTGMPGIKDERIGMFINGPYMMGVIKDGAPEQSGKWAVAPAPVGKQQGSYLGGTGLVIPTGAKHAAAAWEFAQFLLSPKNQEAVFTVAGAAPATIAGLAMPALSEPDPFFGGEVPFKDFEAAMESATPFPYVAQWESIGQKVTDALETALLGKASPKDALDAAAKSADSELAK